MLTVLVVIAGAVTGVFVAILIFALIDDWPGTLRRKWKKQRKAKATEGEFAEYPIKSLPDTEAKTFEHRVATLRVWSKSHEDSWTPHGVHEIKIYRMDSAVKSAMHRVSLDSECDRIEACYKDLQKIETLELCPSGYRYLVVEFYYAGLAIKDLANQMFRLAKLKDLAGDELLPSKRLDPVFDELLSGVNLIIERHFEGELLELTKMAITEQLGSSNALQDAIPSGGSCHTTTAEEIARLKLLVDGILTGSRGDQMVSISEIYPDQPKQA